MEGTYSYRIPDAFHDVKAGMRVLVPFGARKITGFVVDVARVEDARATKYISSLLDTAPVFSDEMLKFAAWMADYYLCPVGDVLKAALPAGMSVDEKPHCVLIHDPVGDEWQLFFETHPVERDLIQTLREHPLSEAALRSKFGLSQKSFEIKRLREMGWIDFRPVLRAPRVAAKMDAMVTLSARAKDRYSTTLFTEVSTRNGQRLLREIFEAGPEGELRSNLLKGANSARRSAFGKLLADGWIVLSVQEISRWDPSREVTPQIIAPKTLTEQQQAVFNEIVAAMSSGKAETFLLHGVTGSGKTQVYIEAIRHALSQHRTALVLVPEIALTPFLWSRFYSAFGDRVAIQHSGQTPAIRYDLWKGIAAGRYPVVIGARSAVFAPLANLGLVVVDEEHEASFKQNETAPRYSGRDAALMRAKLNGAVTILGSATPSIESYQNVRAGRYRMLKLPERIGGGGHPETIIVSTRVKRDSDKSEQPKRRKRGDDAAEIESTPILSDMLVHELESVLSRGKQAMLLQNRRGYAPFLICKSCGYIPNCDVCSVSMTYHRRGKILRCHYCDSRDDAPEFCIRCGSTEIAMYGVGTQRLEEELHTHFPNARLLRMDSDSVSRAGAHSKMITAFAHGDYDILLGTQMIAKGLDFHDVELAAVVQADTELFHPDFRATERGAGLILQLAGRAGRRDVRGKVIVQTAEENHPAIEAVMHGDWERFLQNELVNRDQGKFPPHSRLVLVRAIGKDESMVARTMLKLRNLIREGDAVEVLGPSPAVVAKIRNEFRYQIIARTPRKTDADGSRLRHAVKQALGDYKQSKRETGVVLEIDVDPQTIA